jgi:hypothetical protein
MPLNLTLIHRIERKMSEAVQRKVRTTKAVKQKD